jgi:hypothetical protein
LMPGTVSISSNKIAFLPWSYEKKLETIEF